MDSKEEQRRGMRAFMKVFIPMSDAALGSDSDLYQQLVPFDPSFLTDGQRAKEGRKPSNWVSECDYEEARERLYATRG